MVRFYFNVLLYSVDTAVYLSYTVYVCGKQAEADIMFIDARWQFNSLACGRPFVYFSPVNERCHMK